MGKASTTKKVARAAGTGGGRTARGNRPYGWYSILTVFVALGVFLVVFSRHEQQQLASFHPRGNDHWHAAYAIDVCGKIEANLAQNSNLSTGPGLHTHGDGLIHVEPSLANTSTDAGKKATLARFAETYPGLKLTSTSLQYPGDKLQKNGDKCGTKAAQVRIRVWSPANGTTSITYSNPKDVHLKDQEAITIAFLPSGDEIPKPPAANLAALKNPNAGEAAATSALPPVSVPGATPTTRAPGSTATTTPGATTGSTAAGSTPTTAAPSLGSTPPASTNGTGSPPTSAK